MVQLVYLARLRDALGCSSERVELPDGIGSVDALLEWLRKRGGAWALELAPGRAVRIAVNYDIARGDTLLKAGDEIALFPPVTGG